MTGERTLPGVGGIQAEWTRSSAGWNTGMDANLRFIDMLLAPAAVSATTTAPPVSPVSGDRYIIPSGATGAWAGKANQIALFDTSVWRYWTPTTGWRFRVMDAGLDYFFSGGTWFSISTATTETVDNVYTTSGAINVNDRFLLFDSGSALAMTLGTGANGHPVTMKRIGSGAVTITGNFDGVPGTAIALNSPNGPEAVRFVYSTAKATWLRLWTYDSGLKASDYPTAGALTGNEILTLTQSGNDVQVTLSTLAVFLGASVVTATAATTPVTVPSNSTAGAAITGLTTTLTPSNATAYASLTVAGVEQTPRVAFTGTAVPSLTPAGPGSSTIKIWAASTGGTALATSAAFTVTVTATSSTLSGFPTTGTAGQALNLSGATISLAPSNATAYAALHDGSAEVGSRTSFTGSTPPTKTPGASGTFTYRVYAQDTGGSPLVTSAAITVASSSTPTLNITGVTPVGVGATATISGTFANGAPASLTATMDGSALTLSGINVTTTSGSGATAAGTITATYTNPAAGSHALIVSGTGTYSSTSNTYSYTTVAAPNAVTSLAKTGSTTTSITLSWAESGGTPTTRTITYRSTGSGSYVAVPGTTGLGSTGATVTGLTASTAYDFQVVESNTGGTSAATTLTNVSTSSGSTLTNPYKITWNSAKSTTYTFTTKNAGSYYGTPGGANYFKLTPSGGGTDLPNNTTGVVHAWHTSSTSPPGAAVLPSGFSGSAVYNGYSTPSAATAPFFNELSRVTAAITGTLFTVTYYFWVSADSGATWSIHRDVSDVPIAYVCTVPAT